MPNLGVYVYTDAEGGKLTLGSATKMFKTANREGSGVTANVFDFSPPMPFSDLNIAVALERVSNEVLKGRIRGRKFMILIDER